MLWTLQELNNTDKHRLIPVTVIGIDAVVLSRAGNRIGTVQSPDVVLQDNQVFFSFTYVPKPDEDIHAELTSTVAFQQIMNPYGMTLGIDGVLLSIASRVGNVIDKFRDFF